MALGVRLIRKPSETSQRKAGRDACKADPQYVGYASAIGIAPAQKLAPFPPMRITAGAQNFKGSGDKNVSFVLVSPRPFSISDRQAIAGHFKAGIN